MPFFGCRERKNIMGIPTSWLPPLRSSQLSRFHPLRTPSDIADALGNLFVRPHSAPSDHHPEYGDKQAPKAQQNGQSAKSATGYIVVHRLIPPYFQR
jgi:hypothetical protein